MMPFFSNDFVARLRDTLFRARGLVQAALYALLFSAIGVGLTYADDAAQSPYKATLREHGIEPDAAGLGEYLRQLHPDDGQRRAAQRLIEQLSGERYADREFAMKRLIALPVPPTEALRAAVESEDPEVRWRATKILAVQKPQRLVLMHAVFKTIEHEKTAGLATELVRAVALCENRYLRMAVQAALRATAGPDDAPLLREATRDEDKEVVIAGIIALAAALGADARDDLRRLSKHKTDEISLAAARALANQGDRASLSSLVKLLDSDAQEVRIVAVRTLRQVSGEQHNFMAYENAAARNEAITLWAAWVEREGRTAKLHFPLKNVGFEIGRTLITIYGQGKVIELDASGKQIWEKTSLNQPWASTGLPNGHRIISEYGGRKVTEYDGSGKVVWSKEGLPASPFNVRRLENGNTLIACSDSQKVLEIRPDGTTAWEITINGRPMDVRRLDNGRTLVTLQNGNRVVEVDREGKEHWELKGVSGPITSQRLEDGNTLVAEVSGGRVAEWDRDGKLVWEHKNLQNPYNAERLSNGNTLIVHGKDVREVDRKGKIIWQKQMTGLAHASRY